MEMTILPDYYAILQVHPSATREVIDVAYRKLASKYHPDVSTSPDAADKMKQLNEAYEVLTDPSKRAAYDRTRDIAPVRASSGRNWRILIVPIGLALLILLVAKLKTLGLLLLVFAVVIWLLARAGR